MTIGRDEIDSMGELGEEDEEEDPIEDNEMKKRKGSSIQQRTSRLNDHVLNFETGRNLDRLQSSNIPLLQLLHDPPFNLTIIRYVCSSDVCDSRQNG